MATDVNSVSFCILGSSQSIPAFENYLRVLSSSTLSDLGISSKSNVMTDKDIFQSLLTAVFITPPKISNNCNINVTAMPRPGLRRGSDSQIDMLLGDLSDYGIPFTSINSTQFSLQYLCNYQAWKPLTSFVIDVCVATSSLLMVFGGALKLAVAFFARRTLVSGEPLAG